VIVPGASILLHGTDTKSRREPVTYSKMFKIGDQAECGAYNLIYTGVIRAITEKTITIVENEDSPGCREVHRFDVAEFDRRNWDFDADEVKRHNAEESQCI